MNFTDGPCIFQKPTTNRLHPKGTSASPPTEPPPYHRRYAWQHSRLGRSWQKEAPPHREVPATYPHRESLRPPPKRRHCGLASGLRGRRREPPQGKPHPTERLRRGKGAALPCNARRRSAAHQLHRRRLHFSRQAYKLSSSFLPKVCHF